MKVHPIPIRKRNITLRNDIVLSAFSQKKLRRLPHIFAKVLELPFHSDADVSIQETSDSFRFVIPTDADDVGLGRNIAAHIVEIYPGVTKIVVRGDNVFDTSLSLSGLEPDLWRFRLPAETSPELATAAFSDGELVVTVPKGSDDDGGGDDGDIGGAGRLVLVK
ncbi:uncharacterized protein LOC107794912 [Nicotiana tabacum]|uniref:Uncharacterized protein LOC107794912 n=1 Tax=Nicotiana tabacum TaxID=4097 RepID=A0A1S4A8I9_TOBAC|nr:uncharacterized protein LOC104109107 [Nicotiana tomentosiformis]XP_016472957.1 PREDICTED: uncharacterized protein LOC107794912 [Nicotiana tabacum]